MFATRCRSIRCSASTRCSSSRSSRRPTMRCRRPDPVPEEVRRAADLLERRWTLSVLYASVEGAARFNEFRQALGRVPPATLTGRLTELVDAGLLERRVLDTRPPAVEYRLTTIGKRFEPVVRALARCTRA